ncbi:type II secretion system F family protein [Kerstersia similis]|uniref:type II secretion system F family protein n=1 Tax=Kerstersia similis TaxID=206505 RepID=UPI0039EF8ADB
MLVQGLVIGGVALLLLAAALWLWQRGARDQAQAQLSSHVDQALRQRQVASLAQGPAGAEVARQWRGDGDLGSLMLRAGIRGGPGFFLLAIGVPLLLALLAWMLIGVVAAVGILLLSGVLISFSIWLRIEKRRKRMVAQLPGFLEGMVRLITIGNSMGAAFQSSAANVEMPLREALDRVAALSRSGKDLDDAMRQVARQFDLHEFYLAASVVGVALRFGGRSDQVLDRLAAFMRDLEQARMEMSAMSAELRLSAWILGLLPIALAGFILFMNNDLFMNMWQDPLGFKMLIGAAVMQTVGVFWLYRLAKSV